MTDTPYRPENEGPLAGPDELGAETEVRRRPGAVRHAREARARPRPGAHPRGRRHQRRALPDHAPARRAVARRPRRARCARWRRSASRTSPSTSTRAPLFVENQVFPEESVTYRKLIDELLATGISAVTFYSSMTAEEGAALIELLGDARRHRHRRRARRSSRRATCAGSRSPRPPRSTDSGDEERNREVRARARESYDAGIGRDARHRVAGQARARARGRAGCSASSSRCSTTCSRTRPPSSA